MPAAFSIHSYLDAAWYSSDQTKDWAESSSPIGTTIREQSLVKPGHGAMSGTNFKKNQKSKTPYLLHYKLCHLKE